MRQIEIRQSDPEQSEFTRKPKRKGSPPALLLLLMALTALTALAALMLTGCSEKEEDVLVDMNMSYEPVRPGGGPRPTAGYTGRTAANSGNGSTQYFIWRQRL